MRLLININLHVIFCIGVPIRNAGCTVRPVHRNVRPLSRRLLHGVEGSAKHLAR